MIAEEDRLRAIRSSNAGCDFIETEIGVLNELSESFDQCIFAGL